MKQKFYIFLFVSLFLLAFSDGGVDITINVQPSEDNSTSDILITVVQGEPEFSYYLCDKEPWSGGTIIKEKGPVHDQHHVFKNIDHGTYFVAVRDKNKSLKGEYITIKKK